MKPNKRLHRRSPSRGWVLPLGLLAAVSTYAADETNAPPAAAPAQTPEQMFEGGPKLYNNWIDFSAGGLMTSRNAANFQQQHQIGGVAFGGIEGMHYSTNLDKTTTFTVDGRMMAVEHDYKLRLDLQREKVGYVRLSYREFRTWTDADGGFFPPAKMNIVAEDVRWTPFPRLSPQAGVDYVLSDAMTPASAVTQAILDARNNYWTLNCSSGLVLDNKTDLNLGCFYYEANDYSDNSLAGVPYGAGGREHSVTATLTPRINDRLRVTLKYGYFRYLDAASGGNGDFGSNLIYATMRYRF